jgi:hypothetical protein
MITQLPSPHYGFLLVRKLSGFFALLAIALASPLSGAQAGLLPFGGTSDQYVLLYTGTGGKNLAISNVFVGGNIGVGGTGVVQFSGPGTIDGRLDFAAANTGQYHNSNSGNVGPTSVNYGVTAVQDDLTTGVTNLTNLSNAFVGLGNNIALSGTQTVNESAGQLDTLTINGVTQSYRVFNVTSYSQTNGNNLTINSDGSGDPVIFNFAYNSNTNLGGDTILSGLSPDQVLYNFTSSGENVSLNNNASTYGTSATDPAFQGVILALNDAMSAVNANIVGRLFGGDSSDFQYVSGANIHAPPVAVPEPASLALFAAGLFSFGTFLFRVQGRQATTRG